MKVNYQIGIRIPPLIIQIANIARVAAVARMPRNDCMRTNDHSMFIQQTTFSLDLVRDCIINQSKKAEKINKKYKQTIASGLGY